MSKKIIAVVVIVVLVIGAVVTYALNPGFLQTSVASKAKVELTTKAAKSTVKKAAKKTVKKAVKKAVKAPVKKAVILKTTGDSAGKKVLPELDSSILEGREKVTSAGSVKAVSGKKERPSTTGSAYVSPYENPDATNEPTI